jgi:hypothetical protein
MGVVSDGQQYEQTPLVLFGVLPNGTHDLDAHVSHPQFLEIS